MSSLDKQEEDTIASLISAATARMMIVEVSFQLPYGEAIEVIQYVKKFKSQQERKEI